MSHVICDRRTANHRREGGAMTECGFASARSPGAGWVDRELIVAAKQNDADARAQLIEVFTPLIAGVARLYRPSAVLTTVELMQEGAVGLLRALERYDPELATPFWAYASWWVRQAMQRLVSELTRPVVLSDRAMRQLARVEAAHRAYVQAHRREPTVDQLAAAAGLERAQVEHLIAAARMPRGLDEPVSAAEGSSATLAEQIADPRAEEAYERVPSRLQIARLGGMLASLSERERIVVRARYGLDCPRRTLRELGEQLGVSAERVRQIEERALDNLRAAGVPPARPPG